MNRIELITMIFLIASLLTACGQAKKKAITD